MPPDTTVSTATRELPLRAAEWTAEVATRHRTVVLADVLGLFIVLPLLGVLLLG
ncbi:MAG: hypothetical protein ACNA8R_05810 [Nitriliruptoraceae bacterium]